MKALAIAGLSCLVLAVPLHAQGWIQPPRPGPWQVERTRTDVSVHVHGRIAQVEVVEWFENRGPALGEAEYLYPLPGEAVFTNVSLYQGDQELKGETMDADQARTIYQQIVRKRRDPALVELVGHGLLRARLFPIARGEQRKITLRFTEVLKRAGDALEFRYAGGRPAGAASATGVAPTTFTLHADSAARYRDPFSPTHTLHVTRARGALTVRADTPLAGDLAVFLPFAKGPVGIALSTYRVDGEPGYFMLTLSPGAVTGPTPPRDITAVVDVSGSMSGEKITQVKAALRELLGRLGPRDRFRLIRFSNDVVPYADGWTAATPQAVDSADRWVDALEADGGTNVAGALAAAFADTSPADRLPLVVFLTDGIPTVGERNPEQIADAAQRLRGDARVFAFGVGNDVNTYLLDRLSAAARGATEYVAPGEDVERALGLLAQKIEHPVLTDLALHAPTRVTEIYPMHLPDLFGGEDLVIFGRYEPRTGDRPLTISGQRGGHAERYSATVSFPTRAEGNRFIPRLWASRKLGFLQQQVRLEGRSPELVDEIRRTALRYGLVSEYTSYLVQEPMQVAVLRTPAAANVAAEGALAVKQAKTDRAYRQVTSVAAMDAAALEAAKPAPTTIGGVPTQQLAGRLFALRDSVWTDVARSDSQSVITIAPYSPAYFAVLRALPELVPYASRFERVLVGGADVSIRIAPGGLDEVTDLRALVRRFRGA
ncbi:MAG TPA: VIT domain-containing protein [Gemmatimonadales bacterium]|nr:VIT domain-containing protein [Gemmatimonadales bacterium]